MKKSILFTIIIAALGLQSCISLAISGNDLDSENHVKVSSSSNSDLEITSSYTINNSSGDWSINQEKAQFKSIFKKYSGESIITLNVKKAMTASLFLQSNVTKGSMQIQVLDSENNLLMSDDLETNSQTKQDFNFEKTGEYNIKLLGKNTSGNLTVSWEEVKP